jgi:hypothetical protein
MNYTTYLYCDCEYELSLTENDEHVIAQCGVCLTIASRQPKQVFICECRACGHREEFGNEVEFQKEHTCKNCSLQGKIAYSEEDVASLFFLETAFGKMEPCSMCKSTQFIINPAKGYTCPSCRKKPLKQKMSAIWENETEKDA